MGKGLNRARNKQAEMAKKMELAKKQKDRLVETDGQHDDKLESDRLLFAELLAKSSPPPAITSQPTNPQSERKSTENTRNKPKVKAKDVKRKKKAHGSQDAAEEPQHDVPLQQGDTAKRRHFESLLETSQKPLGAAGAAQLVPWVPPYLTNYLVIVADPRRQSGDLRQRIQYLTLNLSPEILSQVIVITADSHEETIK